MDATEGPERRNGNGSERGEDIDWIKETISDETIKDFEGFLGGPSQMKRAPKGQSKKKMRAVSLTEDAWQGLGLLAKLHDAKWGGRVSISALLESIGTFQTLLAGRGDQIIIGQETDEQKEARELREQYGLGKSVEEDYRATWLHRPE